MYEKYILRYGVVQLYDFTWAARFNGKIIFLSVLLKSILKNKSELMQNIYVQLNGLVTAIMSVVFSTVDKKLLSFFCLRGISVLEISVRILLSIIKNSNSERVQKVDM